MADRIKIGNSLEYKDRTTLRRNFPLFFEVTNDPAERTMCFYGDGVKLTYKEIRGIINQLLEWCNVQKGKSDGT